MDPFSILQAGGAIGGGILNLISQGQQQQNSQQAIQMAMRDYELKKRMADQQYELATAGQTDARGNQTRYVPGRGWVVDATPKTQSLINQSDDIAARRGRDELTTGADDKSRNFNRRLVEGSTANPLLDAMRYGYGAPTREGVVGAKKIADVTQVNENADNVKGGYTSAALRTGMGGAPLQRTLASADQGATAGMRTALARGDAEGGPLYEQMRAQFNEGKLNPYNMLAQRSSNPEGTGFTPENISGGLDAGLLQRGSVGANVGGRNAASINAGPLLTTMLSQRSPNYDTFVGSLMGNLKGLFGDKKAAPPSDPTDRGTW